MATDLGFAIDVVVAALSQSGKSAPVGTATTADVQFGAVVVPFSASGWQYRQVAHGVDPSFQDVLRLGNGWKSGRAAFGTTGGTCSWNNPSEVHTHWDLATDMLIRRAITLPSWATRVLIEGTVDDDAAVYFNGHQVQIANDGDCLGSGIKVVVPAEDIKKGTDEVAVRGSDTSGVADFLNVQVAYRAR